MDLIAVVNYNMTAALERKGVSSKRLLVLPHAVDQDFWATIGKADLRCRFHLEDKFIVLYAGSFSPYYDVPNIVLAASLLQKRNPEIHFLLLGTGPDALRVEEMILHRHISNVTYMGPVAPSNVADYLRASDLFLAPLVSRQSLKFYRNHLSTKVCEYLAVGRPVVAIGNGATLGDFLGRIEAGAGVPMGQPEALAAQIKFYATHHEQTMRCGLNARRYALEHLDRRSVIRTFERQLVLKLVSA
jgi:glycosyltransferase involved in cell wall biosynthesis